MDQQLTFDQNCILTKSGSNFERCTEEKKKKTYKVHELNNKKIMINIKR